MEQPGPTNRVGGLANFIWSIADLLRGDYKQSEFGKVILPLTVIRRLDAVLEPTKQDVVAKAKQLKGKEILEAPFLKQAAGGLSFYNSYPLSFPDLLADPDNVGANLRQYILHFSEDAQEIIERYDFLPQIQRLEKAGLLYQVVAKFAEAKLHPSYISQMDMGYLFEELIRRFSEQSNETAGEHYTPREVIELMVNLLLHEDDPVLSRKGVVKTLYDPACGTGGMLSVAQRYVSELNPDAQLITFGQELNDETFAMCRSDLLIKSAKGNDASNIQPGNSFSEDKFKGRRFDYMLANPPFGVDWKKVEKFVKDEAASEGGRFEAGLPTIKDGSFLFLQHMISKMKPVDQGGSRMAIVFSGSHLTTGAAGSGESKIRRWILENDWLEGVIALPDQLFYNTEISTYIWVLSNRKKPEHEKRVLLVDARTFHVRLRKSLGLKKKEISQDQIKLITEAYSEGWNGQDSWLGTDAPEVRLVDAKDFGYKVVPVSVPSRNPDGDTIFDARHRPIPDKGAGFAEVFDLEGDVESAFAEMIHPYIPDAWFDPKKIKIGYEIPFVRAFMDENSGRTLGDVDADLGAEQETLNELIERLVR